MKRTQVISSDIASIGYDPGKQVMEVEFIKSGVYSYYNVPATTFAAFMAADSKGRFFNQNVRDNPAFPYEKGEDVDFERI